MTKSESIKELATALCKFQAQVEGAKKTSDNPFYKSKYADLGEIWKTIREPLTANGLSVTQTFEVCDAGFVTVETTLLHTSGEWLGGRLTLPLTKNDPQQMGSAITYGRRYALAAILGIHQEDDDGETHRKPDRNSSLEKAKDKASAELKKYNATDNYYLDLDNCKDEKSIQGVVLTCKTAFERRKQQTVPELQESVVKGLELLGKEQIDHYDTPKHVTASVKKWLGVDNVADCQDVDKLSIYLKHLRAKYYVAEIQKLIISLDIPSNDPIIDKITTAGQDDDDVKLKSLLDELKKMEREQ